MSAVWHFYTSPVHMVDLLASCCARRQRAVHFGMQKVDVVIAGGGAVGSATAYFLVNQAAFSGSIVVIEPDPTYSFAASALSARSIRRQFSTPINIEMSAFGMEFLRDCDRGLANVNLKESTYLNLATPPGEAALSRNVEVQRRCGVAKSAAGCCRPRSRAIRGSTLAMWPWAPIRRAARAGSTAMGCYRDCARQP